MPAARAAAVAAAAFSRLCAPGISGSAGSGSSAANSMRRAPPGTSPKPRGTTATSSAVLVLEDPQLGGPVRVEVAVPVEMVGLQVEQHRDPGPEAVDVLELEARELADDPVVRRDVADELAERSADVPGGTRAEHRAEQLGRRRLAVRARHADDRVREQPRRQLDLAPDGDPTLARRHDERRFARNAGALDQHVDAVEQGEILVVAERPVRRRRPPSHPPRARPARPARAREAEDERPLQSLNWR